VAGALRPRARHQLAVPTQNGVRRHDRRNLRQQPATETLPQLGEASALAVVETQEPPGEPGFQQSILVAQERNDVGLLTIEPVLSHNTIARGGVGRGPAVGEG
jgi:hypothetical protein